MADNRAIPVLEGWMIVPVAAEILGLSRQWVWELVTVNGTSFRNVRRLPGTGERPAAILVRASEVERIRQARAATPGCPQCRRDIAAAAAAGQLVDVGKLICPHVPAETPSDPELEAVIGL
jgi:hypothetical protein